MGRRRLMFYKMHFSCQKCEHMHRPDQQRNACIPMTATFRPTNRHQEQNANTRFSHAGVVLTRTGAALAPADCAEATVDRLPSPTAARRLSGPCFANGNHCYQSKRGKNIWERKLTSKRPAEAKAMRPRSTGKTTYRHLVVHMPSMFGY
jgi:hypothetical protein